MASMLIQPIQHYIKRLIERHVFAPVLEQAGHDPRKAQCRLYWGMEKPEIKLEDLVRLAEISASSGVEYVRAEEARRNLSSLALSCGRRKSQLEKSHSHA